MRHLGCTPCSMYGQAATARDATTDATWVELTVGHPPLGQCQFTRIHDRDMRTRQHRNKADSVFFVYNGRPPAICAVVNDWAVTRQDFVSPAALRGLQSPSGRHTEPGLFIKTLWSLVHHSSSLPLQQKRICITQCSPHRQ